MTTQAGRGADAGLVRRTETADRQGSETSEPSRDTQDRIFNVLAKHISGTSALAALNRAGQACGVHGQALEPSKMPAFFAAIEKFVTAQVDRRTLAMLRGELEFELAMAIGRPLAATLVNESVVIRSEWDVSVARARAREMVTALGGRSYDAVKAMTIVSELARNILRYTPGGWVAFVPGDNPKSFVVCATDQGPGITNLDEIFSGRYRSKTGLGNGLVGVKRLAHRFEIETGPGGTHVEATVLL